MYCTNSTIYPFNMAQLLPNELLQVIFKNESQNIKFLHSCLLVNKSWSSNVIPILWNRPFHLLFQSKKKYSHRIISTYFSCKNQHATYNYQIFLRHLSFFSFIASVQEWCNLNIYENDPSALQIPKEIFLFFAKISNLESLDFECSYELVIANLSKLYNFMNVDLFNIMIQILFRDQEVCEWIANVKEILLDEDELYNCYSIGFYNYYLLLNYCRNIKSVSIDQV
jgi:hypothetical protein